MKAHRPLEIVGPTNDQKTLIERIEQSPKNGWKRDREIESRYSNEWKKDYAAIFLHYATPESCNTKKDQWFIATVEAIYKFMILHSDQEDIALEGNF